MSEKKEDAPEGAKAEGGKKGGSSMVIVGVVLSAVLAGGAAYGGARAASKPADHHEPEKPKFAPPGPTVPLEPFIANIPDAEGKPRAIKLTIAIELRGVVFPAKPVLLATPSQKASSCLWQEAQAMELLSESCGS